MRGVNDEDRVQGEAGRSRIDVADGGEKQRREELAVGDAAVQLLDQHLGAALAQRGFHEPHQRLDLGPELDHVRRYLRVGPS